MEYKVQLNLFNTALVAVIGIGVSLMTSTVVASRAYAQRGEQAVASDKTITVKGSARKRIKSDLAVWRIGVQGEAKELKGAFGVLDDGVKRVSAFLEAKGFKPSEIGLAAIETETVYQRDEKGQPTSTISAYRLRRTFFLTTPEVERVHQTAGEVTQLIEQGVLVVSLPPEYYYTKLADLKVAMMGEASKDGRARADEIARNAGCAVAEVRRAQMGVLQITRPNATDVSDYGIYDSSTIDKDVQSVVTLAFGIRPRA